MANSYDVVVVGAGMSGIGAASELAKNGVKVIVLEGRNRLGGRQYTDRESGTYPYEQGCSWLHESLDNPFFELAKKNGIDLVYDDGNIAVYDDNGPLDPTKQLGPASGEFGAFLGVYFSDNQEDISLKEAADKFIAAHPQLSEEQKKGLPQLLRVSALGTGLDWEQLSAKAVAGTVPKGRDLYVLGGYDQVYNVIKGSVPEDSIKQNANVVAVDLSADGVVVKTADGQEYAAKYAIVTAPIGVLKSGHIKFSPQLEKPLQAAVDSTDVAFVGKTYFEFDEVFWNADLDKAVFAGKDFPVVASNWFKFNGQKKAAGLGLITGAGQTKELEKDSSKAFDTLKPFLEALRTDKSKPVPTPKKVTTTKWSVDQFSRGSYSTYKVGGDRATAVAAFEAGAGRVRFAGEHTILRGATFAHGAYRSGVREARYILKHLHKI